MKLKKILILLLIFPLISCSKPTIDDNVLGFFNESIYSNPYFDLNIRLNPTWEINTEKTFDESTISTSDFYAQKEGGFFSIQITIKKLKEIEDENDLIIRYKDEIQKLMQKNTNVVSLDTGKEILGGQEHPYILTQNVLNYDDDKIVNAYEKQFIIKKEDYIAIITLCTFHNDETDSLVSLFM